MNKSSVKLASKLFNFRVFIALIFAFIVGALVSPLIRITDSEIPSKEENDVAKPLYWVAPMDANYRRDKPGQSPMGMDLVPVYAKSEELSGVIKISPDVVNNLGVRLAKVELKKIKSRIKTVGYVKYDEDHLLHIHPRVEGWIEKLHVKASGNPVNKEQPLYEIYSPALVNAQEEYLLALSRKNNRLINAAEERLNALQLPKSAIEELKNDRKVKQRITFYSPQSGVIDNLNIREGFFVKPGTTIMSIGKLDQVWVEAEVFERQSNQIKKGLKVNMTVAFLPGMLWEGLVDYVYPTLDAKTRTIKVRLIFNNHENLLKPNMFAEVEIFSSHKKETLVIPKEALIRTGNFNRVVLSLDEGKFKSIEVKIGRLDDDYVEIISGLNLGETVVSSAQFLLDSESSKTSDFKRMHHSSDNTDSKIHSGTHKDTDTDNKMEQ